MGILKRMFGPKAKAAEPADAPPPVPPPQPAAPTGIDAIKDPAMREATRLYIEGRKLNPRDPAPFLAGYEKWVRAVKESEHFEVSQRYYEARCVSADGLGAIGNQRLEYEMLMDLMEKMLDRVYVSPRPLDIAYEADGLLTHVRMPTETCADGVTRSWPDYLTWQWKREHGR